MLINISIRVTTISVGILTHTIVDIQVQTVDETQMINMCVMQSKIQILQ